MHFQSSGIIKLYSELLISESEKCITIQLIQCANLLVHNLKNENSINYLLSTDFYREILSHPFDFTDDEIIENYLSLLKGLAVNEKTGDFIVVDTDDVLLICKKEKEQAIKEYVAEVKRNKGDQYI